MESFNALTQKSTSSSESVDKVIFQFPSLSIAELSELNSFAKTHKKFFSLTCRTNEGEKYRLPCVDDELVGHEISLEIYKILRADSSTFFTVNGLCNSLKDSLVQQSRTIFIFSEFSEYSSRSCKFKTWSDQDHPTTDSIRYDPRNFIRDSTGGGLVENLEFWILKTPPKFKSEIYEAWSKIATPLASLLFCSEIWKKNSDFNLVFSGSQRLEIPHKENCDGSIFDTEKIAAAANWILEVEREIDIRHSFLASRIASERLRKIDSWAELLNRSISRALENAKNDYKAHLHSKSSETLKAIAELRKSIAEESSKIVDRTHNLTSVLFRDIAIAIGTISIKILTAKNGSTEALPLLLLTAAWLAASLKITTKTNRDYIISLTKSRYLWNKKVNSLIPISEFKELSVRPFKDAVKAYNQSRALATAAYTATIAFLIIFSISQTQLSRHLKDLIITIHN